MSSSFWVWLTVAGVACAAWLVILGVVLWVSRPRPIRAEVATDRMGAEPPAVVALITHRWRIPEEAIAATVLDLAARGVIEITRTGPEGAQATVAVRDGSGQGLSAYEQRVLQHIIRMTAGQQAPISVLAMEAEQEAKQWFNEFRREVAADARQRGLSRPRIARPIWTAFVIGTLVPALSAACTAMQVNELAAVFTGVLVFALLLLLMANMDGERDTTAGRRAAMRWLGVGDFLANRPDFARQPPSSIRDWGRPLAYGAALGITEVINDVLTIGVRAHARAWSSYGRAWQRIAIKYPWYPWWGWSVKTAVSVSLTALGWAGVAWWIFTVKLTTHALAPLGWFLAITSTLIACGLMFGALADLAIPKRIEGQVLHVTERGRRKWGGPHWMAPPRRWIAIDDGKHDHITAYVLPASMPYPAAVGDVVTISVGRFLGLIRSVTRH